MNTPGTVGDHNWSWRVRAEALNPYVSGKLREITRTYRRCLWPTFLKKKVGKEIFCETSFRFLQL